MALVTDDDVFSYLGHDAEQDAFWIHCSDAAAVPATTTAQVALDRLILNRSGAPDANWDLTLAPHNTIGGLVNAINGLGNWEAGIYCHLLSDSADLLETGALNCLLVVNEVTFRITGDYLIGQLIARATDFLNRICGRILEDSDEYLYERYDGGEKKIFLRNWPVNEIIQISSGKLGVIRVKYTSTTAYNAYMDVSTTGVTLMVDRIAAGPEIAFVAPATLLTVANAINTVGAGWTASVVATAYNSYPAIQIFRKLNRFALNQNVYLEIPNEPIDGYEVEYESGILRLASGFIWGWRNIFVTYKAGYLAGAIPPLLQQICIELVKNKYNLIGKDTTLKSEKIGRVYAYTMGDFDEALGSAGLSRGDIELFMDRV